jgi:hypothetical protein
MKAIPYTAKSGIRQFRPSLAEDEMLEEGGFCLACGLEACGVEPDARKYRCEACGARKVYGLEELALMGLILIDGDQ